MKIGIYDPYLDTAGGGEKYMASIADVLSQKHEVTLFWNSQKDIESIENRFALNLQKVHIRKNIFSGNFSPFDRLRISRNYDAIIYLSDGSIPLLLSKRLYVHFQFPVEWVSPSVSARLKLKRVNKVFCNSQYTKSFIDLKFGTDSSVIYPPVEIFQKKQQKKEKMILSVGRYVQQGEHNDDKKHGVLIEQFKKLVDNGMKEWKFVIASGVRESEEVGFDKLRNRTKGYPIEFVKNAPNKELWDLYSRATIYWHAKGYGEDLTKNPEKAEHFGISTVEAMGAGAVPVVINAGGQKEVIEDGVDGVLWDTADELINRTKELIGNDSFRKKLSTNAMQSAKRFSKEKFTEHIGALIHE